MVMNRERKHLFYLILNHFIFYLWKLKFYHIVVIVIVAVAMTVHNLRIRIKCALLHSIAHYNLYPQSTLTDICYHVFVCLYSPIKTKCVFFFLLYYYICVVYLDVVYLRKLYIWSAFIPRNIQLYGCYL